MIKKLILLDVKEIMFTVCSRLFTGTYKLAYLQVIDFIDYIWRERVGIETYLETELPFNSM